MKLKEMWKRFWTLDVHNHAGFTLVELIIVIAILAILSTGAIAGYSAYITSANKTADQAMIAEIKNVLLLAYYNGDLTEDGYIVLSTDGVKNVNDLANTTIGNALSAAYGANWDEALKLKYADWKPAQNPNLLSSVQNSNQFSVDSMDELLNSVQYVTDEFAGFLGDGSGSIDADSALGQYLQNAGIDYTTDPQAASNATVLFVGSAFANTTASDEDVANAWLSGDYSAITGGDAITTNAAQYATTLALAKYVEREANLTDKPYSTRLASATGTAVITEMSAVMNDLSVNYNSYVMSYYGFASEADMANGVGASSEAYKDAMAFKAYMTGMTSVSDSLLESTDIGSAGYFTNGAVMDMVNDFIEVGAKLESLGVTHGVVIIISDGNVSSDPSIEK